MNPSDKGAYGELAAVMALMQQGYEVFRAVSPGSSCDLVAMLDGETLRVEVRSGQVYEPTGRVNVVPADASRCDLFVVVVNGEVVFIGRMSEWDPWRPDRGALVPAKGRK